MKTLQSLPGGYTEIFAVNLQTNKKIAILINLLALVVSAVMVVPMHFHVSVFTLFDMSQGVANYFLRFAVLLIAMVVYVILHELVHGITMKALGTKKIKYGFTGLYAYAGSDDYYDKSGYITIALAPVVVFAIVFGILNVLVPIQWFWVIYLLQVINISGAAGDAYVTVKFSRMPADILVQDSGVGMVVYSKER